MLLQKLMIFLENFWLLGFNCHRPEEMKILFLTPRDSKKNLGGVEGHVRILTEELAKRGHKVKELALDEIDRLNKGQAFLSKGRALGYKFRRGGICGRSGIYLSGRMQFMFMMCFGG